MWIRGAVRARRRSKSLLYSPSCRSGQGVSTVVTQAGLCCLDHNSAPPPGSYQRLVRAGDAGRAAPV